MKFGKDGKGIIVFISYCLEKVWIVVLVDNMNFIICGYNFEFDGVVSY